MRKVELLPTRDCEAGYGPVVQDYIQNFMLKLPVSARNKPPFQTDNKSLKM